MFAEYKRDVSHNCLILHGDETINTTSYQVRMEHGSFFMISLQSSRWHLFTNSVNCREKIWK